MTDPRRILMIRPSALGDVCRTVPVLVSLRTRWPDAEIDWIVRDTFVDAVRAHPALNRVIPFERTTFAKRARWLRYGGLVRWLGELRRARYDLVLDLQGLFRSGFFAWVTGAPRRVGYANAREFGWLGVNERHKVPRTLHTVDRMLELVRLAGASPRHDMRLYTTARDRQPVLDEPALRDGNFALLAPTSIWKGKRWPADRFAQVAEELLAHDVDGIVTTGAPGERDQCGPLLELASRNPRVIDRIGGTSVGELMEFVRCSRLVIANDSAALHMAVGFDRPAIALFGPTRVDLVGPYGREADVIQHVNASDNLDHKNARSGSELMERIGVGEVLERAMSVLR